MKEIYLIISHTQYYYKERFTLSILNRLSISTVYLFHLKIAYESRFENGPLLLVLFSTVCIRRSINRSVVVMCIDVEARTLVYVF